MTDVLIAIVFSITLLGLAHTAKSGPTAETALKDKSNRELLQAIGELRNDVGELRHEIDNLRGFLESTRQSNETRASQSVESIRSPTGQDKTNVDALTRKVTWNFNKGALTNLARELAVRWTLNCVIDKKRLEDCGIALTTPISICAKDEMLGSALQRALTPFGLELVVENEVVRMTTRAELVTRTYPVADLVTSGSTLPASTANIDFKALKSLITTLNGPPWSWESDGGSGSVMIFDRTMSLVIRQTEKIHEQIARLLQTLRENGVLTIKLNATLIENPSPDLFQRANLTKPNEKVSASSSLSEKCANTLLKLALEEPRTNVIRPERIVANGRLTSIVFAENSKQNALPEMLVIAAPLEGAEKHFGMLCYSFDPQTGRLVRGMSVISARNPKPTLIKLTRNGQDGEHHENDEGVYLLIRPSIVATKDGSERSLNSN